MRHILTNVHEERSFHSFRHVAWRFGRRFGRFHDRRPSRSQDIKAGDVHRLDDNEAVRGVEKGGRAVMDQSAEEGTVTLNVDQ